MSNIRKSDGWWHCENEGLVFVLNADGQKVMDPETGQPKMQVVRCPGEDGKGFNSPSRQRCGHSGCPSGKNIPPSEQVKGFYDSWRIRPSGGLYSDEEFSGISNER